MFIHHNDAHLFTVDYGGGPRALLAQGGWVGSWELWCQPFTYLSKSWRTAAFDHRGAGATLAPPDSITFDALVADVFAVLDALALPACVLAAESIGSAVALQAAALQPERFTGLVLVAGMFHTPPAPAPDPYARRLEADFAAAMGEFVDACVVDAEPNSAAVRRWGRHIAARSGMPAAARLRACTFGVDVRPLAAQITQPTLLIHGGADAIAPLAGSEWIAAQIPRSRLRVLPGAGHVPTMAYPRAVAEAIDEFFA